MNILLTSVGRRGYMVNYFRDALKGIGQIHASNSKRSYALQMADKWVLTPLIYDNSYIDFLLDYSKKNRINAIISLFDIDLPILAQNKDRFREIGVNVIVPDYKFTQICNDKWKTFRFLKNNGFYSPETFLTLEEVKDAIKTSSISFPIIIKPRWGMGSIGIYDADNFEELEVLTNKSKRKINQSYLRFESELDQDKSIIFQEMLTGEEYGIDLLNDLNGCYIACIPKKKIEMRAGETNSAEIIQNPELIALGKALSKISKHIGNIDIDCFFSNGNYHIIDINCRFGGQYPFSHLAGANFPKAIIKLLQDEKVGKELLEAQKGIIGIKEIHPVKITYDYEQ